MARFEEVFGKFLILASGLPSLVSRGRHDEDQFSLFATLDTDKSGGVDLEEFCDGVICVRTIGARISDQREDCLVDRQGRDASGLRFISVELRFPDCTGPRQSPWRKRPSRGHVWHGI